MTATERVKKWRLLNPGKRNAAERKRYGVKKQAIGAYLKDWVARNREKRRAYEKVFRDRKRRVDPNFRLKDCLRRRLRHALQGHTKAARTLVMLGCGVDELRQHLERQFVPGMTWSNWGKGPGHWNVDHIVPCAVFDLTQFAHQRRCFHFSNLRPLWEKDNLEKGAKV